jgi:hypothetical protein
LVPSHPRAEDKLQVVPMLYHCLRAAVGVVKAAETIVLPL